MTGFDLGDSATDADEQTEKMEAESVSEARTEGSVDEIPEEDDDPTKTPAFPFEDSNQRPIYPRLESWELFEDAIDFEMKRTFRDHGVRNMSGREIHDALVRLAAEMPDEVARYALEARGIEYEE